MARGLLPDIETRQRHAERSEATHHVGQPTVRQLSVSAAFERIRTELQRGQQVGGLEDDIVRTFRIAFRIEGDFDPGPRRPESGANAPQQLPVRLRGVAGGGAEFGSCMDDGEFGRAAP